MQQLGPEYRIQAKSHEGLCRRLISMAPQTLRRSERKAWQRELWTAARILPLLDFQREDFPLSLSSGDRPDLCLQTARHTVGIEVTEAVHPNTAAERSLQNGAGGMEVYVPLRMHPGDPVLKSGEIAAVSPSDSRRTGWRGDEPEWAAAGFVCDAISRKSASVLKHGHHRYERNWLFVYENSSAPAVVPAVAAAIVDAWLCDQPVLTFDLIAILWGSRAVSFLRTGVPVTLRYLTA